MTSERDQVFYDKAAAEDVVQFIDRYGVHVEPWQTQMLCDAFACMSADGSRRYRSANMELARKNGKSRLRLALEGCVRDSSSEDGDLLAD